MEIDVFSDPICPWCFIGSRRLAKALAMRPDHKPVIRWRAFQLNPDMPAAGMDRVVYLEAKFGGPENAARIYNNIMMVGKTVGIEFQFDKIKKTPNTLNAHRLIHFLQDKDNTRVQAFVNRLFEAYFLEGQDIGDIETLTDLAVIATGGNAGDIRHFLASHELGQDVVDEDMLARRIGINGVPCFIIDGQYALSGAQEPEAFMPLFDLAGNRQERSAAAR